MNSSAPSGPTVENAQAQAPAVETPAATPQPQAAIAPQAAPAPAPAEPAVQYVDDQHAELVTNVQASVNEATGEEHVVEPVTHETRAGDSIIQFVERALLGRPGKEPSKSFLTKLKDRLARKHPDAEIVEK